jgi:hypothetical protein
MAALPKAGLDRIGIGANRAIEGSHVMTSLGSWLDPHKRGRRAAF